jgi:hypothetical protein
MQVRSSLIPILALLFSVPGSPAVAGGLGPITSPDGRRQIETIEATSAITLDGALDEEIWQRATPANGFVQAEPHEGEPATEDTDVRVLFDKHALYIGVLCRDSDPDGIVINDIRKDFLLGEQDTFQVILDTFADRRNGFVFITNPKGARADTQIANEGRDVNVNWDAVWEVGAKIVAGGWSIEIRIPFKTLRFSSGTDRIWGINFARTIRRKNETDYWSPVPRVYNIYRASLDGNLAGLPDVAQGRNLRVKPYLLGRATRATGTKAIDKDPDIGLDSKIGVTPSLTLDLTVNPDFAQAEADQQQVNLTQFSLFYPEKREFFLENAGTFYFGDIPRDSRTVTRFAPPEEELLLFFSRRIGLTDSGEQIPIIAGGRLTGQIGGFGVGALSIQTDSLGPIPGDNYTVLRGRHNILRNSDVGAIFLSRQSAESGADYNRVAGVDANFRFLSALSVNTFIAQSSTGGAGGDDVTAKGSIGWNADFLHAQYSLLSIGDDFRDDIGFVRRTGIRKHFVDLGIRPRPASLRKVGIRELHPHVRVNYYTDQSNVEVTHTNHIAFTTFMENGAFAEFAWNPRFERITKPFQIRPDAAIPVGSYDWNEYELTVETNHSRMLSLSAVLTGGGFWSGDQRSAQIALLFRPSYRLVVDAGLQRHDISLRVPAHDFTTDLVTLRTGYSFSTKMFLDALLQWNTDIHQFNANIRFNFIHHPLSDLFVVYNEQQFTDRDTPPGRGVIIKYTRMLEF